jgi:hypothetical protein
LATVKVMGKPGQRHQFMQDGVWKCWMEMGARGVVGTYKQTSGGEAEEKGEDSVERPSFELNSHARLHALALS